MLRLQLGLLEVAVLAHTVSILALQLESHYRPDQWEHINSPPPALWTHQSLFPTETYCAKISFYSFPKARWQGSSHSHPRYPFGVLKQDHSRPVLLYSISSPPKVYINQSFIYFPRRGSARFKQSGSLPAPWTLERAATYSLQELKDRGKKMAPSSSFLLISTHACYVEKLYRKRNRSETAGEENMSEGTHKCECWFCTMVPSKMMALIQRMPT